MCILQFADDTIFLCEDSFNNVVTLKAILRGFELASGLKINFHKSKLVGINVQSSDVACYTKTLNCKQMGVLFKYMGLEVGGSPRKKQFWDPIVNKLKAKLSVWKREIFIHAKTLPYLLYLCIISPFSKPLIQSIRGLPLSKGDSYWVGGKKASQFAGLVRKMRANLKRREDWV